MTTTRFGAHVGQHDPIGDALALDAGLVQLFLGDPQSFKKPAVTSAGGAEALRERAEAADVDLYVHAPYLVNVATTNNRVRIPSRKLLQQTVDAAAGIGAKGVIVHGGHVGADDDPQAGFDNWRKAIDQLDPKVPVLIENTAGGANAMARTLDRLALLWEAVLASSNAAHVGFCLDTCHAHAGGNELLGLVDKVVAITGRIDLVHANDSRDAFGSGADRHTNFGKGECDPEGVADVVRRAGAPICVETPGPGQPADLAWLRSL